MAELKQSDVWTQLRRWTPARIGLGRVGGSLPTEALLDFELAHAQARDAVHASFDADALAEKVCATGFGDVAIVRSQARDRMEYLLRPDLGRALDAASQTRLAEMSKSESKLAVVIADGLSALAPERHAIPLLTELHASQGFENVTVVIANQARVALGDAIGEILRAPLVLVLIGERPGLSSPDSLGAYLTWAPRVGRTDAERNCISNIRPQGLSYAEAAHRLRYLLDQARRLQLSGIGLKDDSEESPQLLPSCESPR
ncbi:MAG TPA: ethanolamine ammonia-lyase subunit EutC [Acidobacteriaceae bacterium]|jgi:ethanolamine ammonia-lyase small subunit|nr:ethanolamine ammonia-lyase subunit EutC [Acidobacteriaceae bacterium]